VLAYYRVLRSVRRTKALARHCLTRCRHCGIFLLTHRRNHRRLHLASCPFGCREAHEREQSKQRSLAYYREHPDKKRALNQKRYLVSSSGPSPASTEEGCDTPLSACAETSEEQPQGSESTTSNTDRCPVPQCPPELAEVLPKAQDPEVMRHVRVVVTLIEGRKVSLEEIWQALLHFWRQRTIGHRRKIDHTVAWLNANPP
jgi:hypothetical protein